MSEAKVPLFSLAAIIFNPDSLRNSTVRVMALTLQTGNVWSAPADVFTASAFILADPFSGITMAWAPRHSALLTIAPKFLTSDTPSENNEQWFFPFLENTGEKVFDRLEFHK